MKYPINKEFKFFRRFKPPMNGVVFRLALAMPKCLKQTKTVAVARSKAIGADGHRIPIYIFTPKCAQGKLPVVLYLHGGGFVFKGAPYHYKLAKLYAEKANVNVVYVDYRLAFQGKYPSPLNDCIAAYNFVLANADRLNFDTDRLVLAGDSAGSYLSLALIKSLAQSGIKLPKGLVLIYPVVDPAMTANSMNNFTDTPMWNSKANVKMWKTYSQGNDVYNPLHDDLTFIPPTYIETAEFDCLHDEGVTLYGKLVGCGIDCTLIETAGTMHGFDICLRADTTAKAIDRRIGFLKRLTQR